MMMPQTQYAKNGDMSIASQVVGNGHLDLCEWRLFVLA